MARSHRSGSALVPRGRVESVFLIGVLLIAGFFIFRICQFRTLPRGNTITASLITQVQRSGRRDDEPTKVVTELVISGNDDRFRQRQDYKSGSQVQSNGGHSKGVNSDAEAREHYLRIGRSEGRVYKRLRVLLRYTACTGLINQHYSHIAAFSLSAVLGAEIVLPPAVKRDSFAHYFSVYKEHNEVSWTPAPLESLLNVDKLVDFWRSRGLTVHRTPALLPFPDLTQPEIAYPLYPQPELNPKLITRVENVYLQNLDMPELIEKARVSVIGHAMKVLREDPDADIDYVVLDLPCTFFMLRSLSNLRVVTEVARSLEFSPHIQELADRVIHGMTNAGLHEYNAVHLRIEKDARDWSQIMGGDAVVWHGYVQAMRQAGFASDLVLYVASGLLTYGANEDMMHIVKTLVEFGLCREVHYKEMYIPQAEIDALNSEQKALVDFLVLSRGRGFVGFGSSTFSFYLREFRVLNGIPRSSSVLVDASVIGTDPLFNSAGTVI
ncbi:hypothetical protein WJX72_005905 [[Myrmecia] bisecta]|uniref:O-fucosyltransferase family protein n=1 Tax=[Myrmecia] bisecta TaxID=41462 RepID=A0AAW1PNH9_9CHLO